MNGYSLPKWLFRQHLWALAKVGSGFCISVPHLKHRYGLASIKQQD